MDDIKLDIDQLIDVKLRNESLDIDNYLYQLTLNKKKILTFAEVKLEELISSNLCHYTTYDTFPKLIKDSSKFRLYNVQYLNDPMEGTLLIDLLRDESHFKNNKIYRKIFTKYENILLKKSDCYIASFTYEKDFLPMWSMYGDGGKGICAEVNNECFSTANINPFDENEYEYKNEYQPLLYKVTYLNRENNSNEEDYFYGIILKLKEELINISKKLANLSDDYIDIAIDNITKIIDELRFLFKDKSYSYENECRVVITKKEAELDENNKYFVELPLDIIYKDIVIGPKCGQVAVFAQLALHSEKVEDVHMSTINYQ